MAMTGSRQRERWLAFAAVAVVPTLAVITPILAFLVMSLFRVENNQIVREVNLANYAEVFSNPTYRGTFVGSLWLCVQVAAFTLLIGYPVAWFVWRRRGRVRNILLLLTVLPLFMSYIVKLYALRAALGLNGLLNQALVGMGILDEPSKAFLYNQRAVLMTMTVIFLPFVILPVFISLERIPSRLLEASHDLGATPLGTFRRVVLPLSLPGTVAGALFVFVLAMGDFITPQMVGGTSGFTYGRLIWSQFGLAYNWPLGSAMAGVLLATSLAVILVAGYASRQVRV
jgi:spermidine/putrescine transport system permease protein